MGAPVEYPQRIAMVSLYTSPLATPGVGDAGGLNVYVDEVARRLGGRDRRTSAYDEPEDRDGHRR